jgi:hypothetical protein
MVASTQIKMDNLANLHRGEEEVGFSLFIEDDKQKRKVEI